MQQLFTVDGQQFSSQIDNRTGTPFIRSIHPYDETEYHWARQKSDQSGWVIYRDGKSIAIIIGQPTKETVATRLLNLDAEAHLKRRGGIW